MNDSSEDLHRDPDPEETVVIPTMADIVKSIDADKLLSESAEDDDTLPIPEHPADAIELNSRLLSPEFKRNMTRLIYKKLQERLASTSHEIAVEIMDELKTELFKPASGSRSRR